MSCVIYTKAVALTFALARLSCFPSMNKKDEQCCRKDSLFVPAVRPCTLALAMKLHRFKGTSSASTKLGRVRGVELLYRYRKVFVIKRF